jgi:hypothetical protein
MLLLSSPNHRRRSARTHTGAGAHVTCAEPILFEALLCLPTAPGSPTVGTETSVRRRFFWAALGQTCSPIPINMGLPAVKRNGVISATLKKRVRQNVEDECGKLAASNLQNV